MRTKIYEESDYDVMLKTLEELTQGYDSEGNKVAAYFDIHELMDNFGITMEEAIDIAENNGYNVFRLPGGDNLVNQVVIAHGDLSYGDIVKEEESEVDIAEIGDETDDSFNAEDSNMHKQRHEDLKEEVDVSVIGKPVKYRNEECTIKDVVEEDGDAIIILSNGKQLLASICVTRGTLTSDDPSVSAFLDKFKVEDTPEEEPQEKKPERPVDSKDAVIQQALNDAREDWEEYKESSPMFKMVKKARKTGKYDNIPTAYPELYADTYYKEFDRLIHSVESKLAKNYSGIIERTYPGEVDELIFWLRQAVTNIRVTSGDATMAITQERVDFFNDRDGTNATISRQNNKIFSSWIADLTQKEDILKDMPIEVLDWKIDKNNGKAFDEDELGLVYNENNNELGSNAVVLDLLYEYDFKLGKQKTNEELEEGYYNTNAVDFEYDDLDAETDEGTIHTSHFNYRADRDEVLRLLGILTDLEEEDIEERFDYFVDKYYNELKEAFLENAREAFIDDYNDNPEVYAYEPNYEDEPIGEDLGDEVVEETNEYKIVKTISHSFRYKNGKVVGKPIDKVIYQVYFRTQDYNPAVGRWMNRGWTNSTSEHASIESAREYVKKYGKTLKSELDEEVNYNKDYLTPKTKQGTDPSAEELIKNKANIKMWFISSTLGKDKPGDIGPEPGPYNFEDAYRIFSTFKPEGNFGTGALRVVYREVHESDKVDYDEVNDEYTYPDNYTLDIPVLTRWFKDDEEVEDSRRIAWRKNHHVNEELKEIQVRDNENIEKDAEECPLPLDIIPNNMGINLSNVEKVKWEEQKDGQLKKIEIEFNPAPEDELDEDIDEDLIYKVAEKLKNNINSFENELITLSQIEGVDVEEIKQREPMQIAKALVEEGIVDFRMFEDIEKHYKITIGKDDDKYQDSYVVKAKDEEEAWQIAKEHATRKGFKDYDVVEYKTEEVNEDIEKHDTLNQKLFDGEELKPEIKEKIEQIAYQFVKELNDDDIRFTLKDIVLLGSNVSYNYTKDSDLDIHLIADSSGLECPDDLYPLLYSAYRSMFNKNYDIKIKGIPAEIYVEMDEPVAKSNGIYSLNNGWLKKPEQRDIPDLDEEAFDKLFNEWEDKYFELMEKDATSEDIENFIEDLYDLRKESIATEGEYGLGNLVFKEFRNIGYLDGLKDLRKEKKGKELSLEHLEEDVDETKFYDTLDTGATFDLNTLDRYEAKNVYIVPVDSKNWDDGKPTLEEFNKEFYRLVNDYRGKNDRKYAVGTYHNEDTGRYSVDISIILPDDDDTAFDIIDDTQEELGHLNSEGKYEDVKNPKYKMK